MSGKLSGKVALITGGGSGIGRASALAFAAAGAKVVVADVSEDGGQETCRLVEQAGGEASFVRVDVSQSSEVAALIDRVVETHGRLDCAHNNAGISGGAIAPTADYPEEAWDRVIGVNLKGVWLCMRREIAQMLRQGGGAIVNTASAAGLRSFPLASAYCASKHGVIGVTRTAAAEYLKAGIRVNAVCPGFIQTPMVERAVAAVPALESRWLESMPIGRFGTPEEVARAVIWLCSDDATFITGHALAIDGGMLA